MSWLQALATWRRLCAHHEEMDYTILELMAHPDTTVEQLALVRLRYIEARKSLMEHWQLMQQARAKGTAITVTPQPPKFIQMRIAMAQRRKAKQQ